MRGATGLPFVGACFLDFTEVVEDILDTQVQRAFSAFTNADGVGKNRSCSWMYLTA